MHTVTARTFVITGASGWLGQALATHLQAEGHTVRRLVRRAPADAQEFQWDPASSSSCAAALRGPS